MDASGPIRFLGGRRMVKGPGTFWEMMLMHGLCGAGILEQSMGARNRVGIGLSYRLARARICKPLQEPTRIDRIDPILAGRYEILSEVPACQATYPGEIDSKESIPGLLIPLQIRAQAM
jgi:hypothetical protein